MKVVRFFRDFLIPLIVLIVLIKYDGISALFVAFILYVFGALFLGIVGMFICLFTGKPINLFGNDDKK